MLNATMSLPVWLAYLLFVLAGLGVWAYGIAPLIRHVLRIHERRVTTELDAKLQGTLPKLLRTPRRALLELLFNDTEVQQAMSEAGNETGADRLAVEQQTRQYIDELMPGFFALFYFRIGYWFARRYLRAMYELKVVRRPPADSYGDIPAQASIILVGNHRSNMDVMVLSYLASRTNMISFAAGEWASVWPMNRLLHMSGSYIIRRDSQSRLYKRVLARYLHIMVNAHMPQGIFLEGGLTRDGSIQPVKLGLLRYILATLGKDEVRDIVFIPVAFNYDRVPEDITLLARQTVGFSGRSKFYTLLSTAKHAGGFCWRMLRTSRQHYGQAAVSFGPPLSMQDWLSQRGQTIAELDDQKRKALVAPVAGAIMDAIRAILPVLPVSVIATVFSEQAEKALSELELRISALQTIDRFRRCGADLAIRIGEEENAIRHGLEILLKRRVLLCESQTYRVNPEQQRLLDYYYRSTEHFLGGDSQNIEAVREPPLQSVLTAPEPRTV